MRPQAQGSLTHNSKEECELRAAEWYWGKISREQAKNILAGKPEGSFIVRDALSKEGEYTLTLIKDGSEKLIKICCINGKYGFNEGKFDGVVEMINYYKENSLKIYNKTLDIMLSNPIVHNYEEETTQPFGDKRNLIEEFIEIHQMVQAHQQNLDQKVELYKFIEAEIQEKEVHKDVFQRAEHMFQNQVTIIESFIMKSPPDATGTAGTPSSGNNGLHASCNNIARHEDQEKLLENAEQLKAHLALLQAQMQNLNNYLEDKKEKHKALDRQINSAKPELQTLKLRKDKYVERLKEFNFTDEDLKMILDKGFDEWKQRYDRISNQPHQNESLWLLKDLKRRDAEELLRGAPTGTFLIRAREVGHFALSIVCKGVVQHCIVYNTEGGFGLAAPYNFYGSLLKLVEHYATNSLEEHNDTLTTTLRIPVMYWHQNKELILQQLQEELEYEQQHELIMSAPSSSNFQHSNNATAPMPILGASGHTAGDSDLIDFTNSSSSGNNATPPASSSPSNFSASQ